MKTLLVTGSSGLIGSEVPGPWNAKHIPPGSFLALGTGFHPELTGREKSLALFTRLS